MYTKRDYIAPKPKQPSRFKRILARIILAIAALMFIAFVAAGFLALDTYTKKMIGFVVAFLSFVIAVAWASENYK